MIDKIAEQLLPLTVDIAEIKLDPKNARQHPKPNLEAIKRSLEAYGQRKPIVVNSETHVIEAGNGLYLAAFKLGWTKIAAVMVKDDPNTAKGYAIMDNKASDLSAFDFPNLKDLLEELDTGAFDMTLTGFNIEEIENLMTQFHVGEAGMPELATGDKSGFQQMTFTLSDEQAETVKSAITKSKSMGDFAGSGNENSNGNALARICEVFNGAG